MVPRKMPPGRADDPEDHGKGKGDPGGQNQIAGNQLQLAAYIQALTAFVFHHQNYDKLPKAPRWDSACGHGPSVRIFSMFRGSAKNVPSSELQSLAFPYIMDFKAHNAVCGKNLLEFMAAVIAISLYNSVSTSFDSPKITGGFLCRRFPS